MTSGHLPPIAKYALCIADMPAYCSHSTMDTNEAENPPRVTIPLWINGKEVTTTSTFDVTSPLTNQTCWQAASASTDDATLAVETAQEAFKEWSKTKPTTRRNILLSVADLLEVRIDVYASFMQNEMGADFGVSKSYVIPTSIEMLRDIASRVPTTCGSLPVCGENGRNAIVYKEPYGVVLGIVPWCAVARCIIFLDLLD